MGAFANSVDAVKDGEKLPFAPFSGYNEHIKEPPKGALKKSESGDQNAATAKQPTGTSPADAKKIDPDNPAAKRTSDGKIIRLPCGTEGEETKGNKGTITKIKNAIEGFVQFLQDLKAQFDEGLEYYRDWVDREIDIRAEQITKAATKMISGMVNSLFKKLESILSKGLDFLYGSVYATVFAATLNPVAAHLAGVAAQTAMLQPVKILQDLIPCIVNQILGKVFDLVRSSKVCC